MLLLWQLSASHSPVPNISNLLRVTLLCLNIESYVQLISYQTFSLSREKLRQLLHCFRPVGHRSCRNFIDYNLVKQLQVKDSAPPSTYTLLSTCLLAILHDITTFPLSMAGHKTMKEYIVEAPQILIYRFVQF